MKRWEISAVQAGMLAAGSVSISGHALAVSQFMRAGGRDAWMSGLICLPAAFLAIWSLHRLSRLFPGKTLAEYLPKVLGYAGYLLAALYAVYFLAVLMFTLRMTTDWMIDSVLPETPSWVMGVLYMAAVVYTALGGLDVLARVNQFTLPLVTAFGILVSVSTMQAKDYRLLTPFFEYGYGPVLTTSLLATGYFGEMSIVAMYNAYVRENDRKNLFKVYALALLFAVMVFTGPLAGSMATLGYRVAQNMPYPTFQHWLMVSYARFFERTDLFAVHQWLAGAYVRCGLYLLLAARACSQIISLKQLPFKWLLVGLAGVVVAVSELAFPNKPAFDQFVANIYLPAGGLLGIFLPPLLLIIATVRGLGRAPAGAKNYGG